MLNKILSLLQNERPANAGDKFTRVQVATCALLLEVAHSDGRIEEIRSIRREARDSGQ